MTDHKKLLLKYIRHVGMREGITFIPARRDILGCHPKTQLSLDDFTEEEAKELISLDQLSQEQN